MSTAPRTRPPAGGDREPAKLTEGFVEDVLAGDSDEAVASALAALDAVGGNLARLYDEVLRTAAVRVGDLWHIGSLTVADEHAATATLRRAMAAARSRFGPERRREELVVLACPPGEAHDVGLHMLGDVLDLAGFRVQVLGAETPAADTAEYTVRHDAALVGLSCSTPIGVGGLIASIAALREADPDLPVIVGGRCLEEFPGILGETSPSVISLTVTDGVAEVERMVGKRPGARSGSRGG